MRLEDTQTEQDKQIAANHPGAQAVTSWLLWKKCLDAWVEKKNYLWALLILPVGLMVPLVLNGYWVFLMTLALVYAVATTGFTFILGWAGLLAFCNSAFFGLGAYAGGAAASKLGMPAEIAIVGGGLAGAILGLAFGLVAVRLRRYYLAITAISFMFILDYLFRHLETVTGGVRGLPIPAPQFFLLGYLKVSSMHGQYYVSFLLLGLVYCFAVMLRKSRLGREWQVVRADERVAKALGINIYVSRLKAFAIGFAVISASGAWLGFLLGTIYPQSFSGNEMMFHFLIVAIGGLGSVNGAVGGAILLVVLRQYLRGYLGISEILFGLLLFFTVLALQKGIYGTLAAKFKGLREGFV